MVTVSVADASPAMALSLVLNAANILSFSLQQSGSVLTIHTILDGDNTGLAAFEQKTDAPAQPPAVQGASADPATFDFRETPSTVTLDDDIIIGDEVLKNREAIMRQRKAEMYVAPPDSVVFDASGDTPAVTVQDLSRQHKEANAMQWPVLDVSKPNWHEAADPELRKMIQDNPAPSPSLGEVKPSELPLGPEK
ncbi:hypothetical protein [Solidesulfovibrio sp.]